MLRCGASNYGARVGVCYPSAVSIAPGALKSRSEEGIAHSMGSIAGEERGGTGKRKQLDQSAGRSLIGADLPVECLDASECLFQPWLGHTCHLDLGKNFVERVRLALDHEHTLKATDVHRAFPNARCG